MRKLMWFAIGFGLFCSISSYGMGCTWLLPAAAAAGILSVLVIGFSRKKQLIRPVAVMLTGGMVGLL